VATVAGVDLGVDRDEFAAGVVFRLSESVIESRSIRLGDDLVEINPEAGVVVVFLGDATDAIVHAHEAAQRALDIAAFTGGGAATLPRAHDECVYWWRDGDPVSLRVVVTKEVGIRMGPVRVEVKRDGEIVPPPPPPDPEWTPALRFFRQSQIADDVFDAYRNGFLALEAILSALVIGGPGGERAWLAHALREVESRGTVEIVRYVKNAGADAVEAFLDEQYEALRCATFHAKEHRHVLLPGSLVEREQVAEALEGLTRLVMALAEGVAKVGYRGGAMTVAGFEGMFIAPKVETMELFLVRFDEHGVLDERVPLEVRYVGKLDDDRGFEHGFLGDVAVSEIAGTAFDSLTAASPEAGGMTPALDLHLPILPIDAEGVDKFEVILVFALHNLQQPKRRFVL
jgi:hypothetical protein